MSNRTEAAWRKLRHCHREATVTAPLLDSTHIPRPRQNKGHRFSPVGGERQRCPLLVTADSLEEPWLGHGDKHSFAARQSRKIESLFFTSLWIVRAAPFPSRTGRIRSFVTGEESWKAAASTLSCRSKRLSDALDSS